MRIADDLFLMSLHDRTGRFRIEAGALALGLAGALLGELLLHGNITISEDQISVRATSSPPDSLTHAVVELVAAEPQHRLRTWLAYLARDATEKVAERLVRDRQVSRVESRSLLRGTSVTYPPVDESRVFWRSVRMTKLLQDGTISDWSDGLLAGLANAIGLDRLLLRDSDGGARQYMQWLLQQLSAEPGMTPLISSVHATIAARTLNNRS